MCQAGKSRNLFGFARYREKLSTFFSWQLSQAEGKERVSVAKIYLIRHAESIANTQGIYQGQSYDTELSPLGKKQAVAVGEHLASIRLDAIYTSPLKRSLLTAQAIQQQHHKSVRLFLERDLMETNHGDWEGKSKQEIAKGWKNLYEKWLTNPLDVEFPHGEKYQKTIHRVVSWHQGFLNQLEKETSVVLVTHSNVIQILWAHIRNIGFERLWKMPAPQATSVTLIEVHSPTRIVYQNDATHLKELKSNLSIHAI